MVVTFVLPFLVLLVTATRSATVVSELVFGLSAVPSAIVVFAHATSGELAFGGYLASLAIIAIAILSLMKFFKAHNKYKLEGRPYRPPQL